MVKFKMIADDLTGANANCSLMKKIGLTSATLFDLDGRVSEEYDAIAVTTNSRAIAGKEAYNRVTSLLGKLRSKDTELYAKRVDSTLRGNIGQEVNAFFDLLGDEYMGIAAVAYPATGRIVVNGTMFVNGDLLVNSDAGRDTKTPVTTSNVLDLLTKDLRYKAEMITIGEIEKGIEYLSQLIKDKQKQGIRLLVFDGIVDKHLTKVVKAALESKVKFFTVDPGPATLEVANQMLKRDQVLNKILMVIGSVTDTSIEQIRELLGSYDFGVIKVDAEKLATEDKREKEINRATNEALEILKKENYILLTTTPYEEGEKRIDLSEIAKDTCNTIDDISIMISDGIAEIARNIVLSDFSFAGSLLSGGDITVAFSHLMGSQGIDIREEIIPLTAYGRMIGGLSPDHRIISKGGMVGDKNAMKIILEEFRKV